MLFGALSQGNQTTAGNDVANFINSLKDYKSDLSTFSLMQQYLIAGLKNRIPPEIGISGVNGTIQFDELLRQNLNKPIDSDKVCELLGGSMSETEIKELITKIEEAKNEWNIYAVEYGKAISICMTNKFGDNINSDNFIPCQSSGKTLNPSEAARSVLFVTPSWRASRADRIKWSGLNPDIFRKGETKDD